jgi:hypothetical protein
MEEKLRYILALASEHLKFAETKNAAILAANAAVVLGVLQILSGSAGTGILRIYLAAVGVCSTIAALIALISFLPQTHIPWLARRESPTSRDSLVFFGDIQKYSPNAYLEALRTAAGGVAGDAPPLELMLAEQIVVNSRIASRKFTYFRYAIWVMLSGVLSPILTILLFHYVHDQHES